MSWWYRTLLRPVLFTQDAESIHNRAMRHLNRMARSEFLSGLTESICRTAPLPVSLLGLNFENPVGLAAGMDKNAEALPAWARLGFGFTELGAVTWRPQPGNATPRVFRAIPANAIVNRMGFNNAGAEAVAAELANWKERGLWPKRHPTGMNLGKSKVTPLLEAAKDYARSFQVLHPHIDFFVINVSSPNTPNLRELQDKQALAEILAAVQSVNRELSGPEAPLKPLLVKVAPDLGFDALDEILELVPEYELAGLVATNTTITRPAPSDAAVRRAYDQPGGLSGQPLRQRSTEVIRHIHRQSRGKVPVIGVGGIFNAQDAWEKILAGASLLQVYTGFVYEGPTLAASLVRGLREHMASHGFKTLAEAVGAGNR
jgi:dihydroorotate dehydrogenase